MAGKAAQTSSEMPAKISFLRPAAAMALATRSSSKALTDERSMISTPGRASTSSGNVGPHMLSRAVVVTRAVQPERQFKPAYLVPCTELHSSYIYDVCIEHLRREVRRRLCLA